jgi:ribose transport system permease protein
MANGITPLSNRVGPGLRIVDWITGRRNAGAVQLRILFLTVVGLCVASAVLSPVFLTRRNILNVLQQVAVLEIVAVGTLFVMISGGIDLSIGNMISFIAGGAALFLNRGTNPVVVVLAAVVVAMASGLVNGLIITRTRCEPFIITLGMMSVYEGLAFIVVNGRNIGLVGTFQSLGRGSVGFIPVPVLAFVVIDVVMFLVLRYTKFGRKVFAIGGNEEAAFLAGIKISFYKPVIYMINGAIVGIAAVILLSRVGGSNPLMGLGFELQAIAAVAIGGVTLSGGKGSVQGAFLGVLLLGVISNALSLMDVPYFYQYVTLGLLIVGAVVLSNVNKSKRPA